MSSAAIRSESLRIVDAFLVAQFRVALGAPGPAIAAVVAEWQAFFAMARDERDPVLADALGRLNDLMLRVGAMLAQRGAPSASPSAEEQVRALQAAGLDALTRERLERVFQRTAAARAFLEALPRDIRAHFGVRNAAETFRVLDGPFAGTVTDLLGLANQARRIDGKDPLTAGQVSFHASQSGGFFMARTHVPPHCHIGHGALDSWARLRLFLHEIGHIGVVVRESDEVVMAQVARSALDLVANEQDSYRYEILFLDHVETLCPAAVDVAEHRRKQYVARCLKLFLDVVGVVAAYHFHRGCSVERVSRELGRFVERLDPGFQPADAAELLRFSPLQEPLRQVAYIDAFLEQYRPHAARFLGA